MYRSELIRLIEVDPQKEVVYRAKLAKYLGKVPSMHYMKPTLRYYTN